MTTLEYSPAAMIALPRDLRVSVVVPAFDAAATVRATIASVQAQTITDIEILAIDDGSRDATYDVLKAIAAQEPRLRITTQPNAGVSAARNAGIRSARAPLVALIDADDLWHRDHLARHLERFSADARLGLSFSAARFIDRAGLVVGAARAHAGPLRPEVLLASNPTTTCSTLVFHRAIFEACGGFDETLRRSEDQEWLFRIARAGWRIAGIADATVDYRISPGGLASDLDGMHRGFEAMLARARVSAPDLVARHEHLARAEECLYLARRAGQLDLGPGVVRTWLMRALAATPAIVLKRPARVAVALCDVMRRNGRIAAATAQEA
jgi:glycosyltransferase involved in cell wall biosynthesis